MEIDNIYFIDKSKNVKNENTKQICDFEQYLQNIYMFSDIFILYHFNYKTCLRETHLIYRNKGYIYKHIVRWHYELKDANISEKVILYIDRSARTNIIIQKTYIICIYKSISVIRPSTVHNQLDNLWQRDMHLKVSL